MVSNLLLNKRKTKKTKKFKAFIRYTIPTNMFPFENFNKQQLIHEKI